MNFFYPLIMNILLVLLWSDSVFAKVQDMQPILLRADKIEYYDNNQVIVATGNVEVVQKDEIIKAEKIIYNRLTSTITSDDNIQMLQSNGNIIFADKANFQQDLSSGLIENFQARLTDDSTFAANSAVILQKDIYQLNKGVYSACKVCHYLSPMWQIKANEIIIDKVNHQVNYKNAFFEIYGIPMLYSPYLSHPDSEVKRKNGFLVPKTGSSSLLGRTISTPYYLDIAPNKDLIITPIFTTKAGKALLFNFRHLTTKGIYNIEGSKTDGKIKKSIFYKKKGRYHLLTQGDFILNNKWKSGFDLLKISDISYLKEYQYIQKDYYTNFAYLDYDQEKQYSSIKALHFKRFRLDNENEAKAPTAIPYVNYYFEQANIDGLEYSIDGNLLGLHRKNGTCYKRGSITNALAMPIITNHGFLFNIKNSLRTDLYDFDALRNREKKDYKMYSTVKKSKVARVLPETQLTWRFPLIGKIYQNTAIIEPMAIGTWSPKGTSKNHLIPNEDSTNDIELYDNNLFNANHFPGYDRLETGFRSSYGIRTALTNVNGVNINLLLGQYIRHNPEKIYNKKTEKDDMISKYIGSSDYVGRLLINPTQYFNLNYQFLLDKKHLSPKREEIGLALRINKVNFNMQYIMQKNKPDLEKDFLLVKRQIVLNSDILLFDQLTLGSNFRKNLSKGHKKLLSLGGHLTYKGDCIDVHYEVNKDFTRDATLNNRNAVLSSSFKISFKNLTN